MKKGMVISYWGYVNPSDALRGGTPINIKSIVIPDMNNLAITVHEDEVYLQPNFSLETEHKKLGEIKVPDDFAEMVTEFGKTRKKIIMDFFRLTGEIT